MALDPNVMAMLMAALGGGGYSSMPEYSTSKGWLPADSGTIGANLNQLQDIAGLEGQGLAGNPLVMAALGMATGDSYGSRQEKEVEQEGVTEGLDYLTQIVLNDQYTGIATPEGLIAKRILDGMSPTAAYNDAKTFWNDGGKDEYKAQYGDTGIDTFFNGEGTGTAKALDLAASYHEKLMSDKPEISTTKTVLGDNAQKLVDMGVPLPGTKWDLNELNPKRKEALDASLAAEDELKSARAGTESKPYMQNATQSLNDRSLRQRENDKPNTAVQNAQQKIVRVEGTPDELKRRRDAIAGQATSRKNTIEQNAKARALEKKLMEMGMDPTRMAALKRLGAIQGMAF